MTHDRRAGDASTLAVDRGAAAARAGWLGGFAAVLAFVLVAAFRAVRWQPMWTNDRATVVALAFVFAVVACMVAAVACRAISWLLLAIWPRHVGIEVSSDAIVLRLGPFGVRRLDAARLRSEPNPEAEFDALTPDDDPMLPRITHPGVAGDVVEHVARLTRATAHEIQACLARVLPGVRHDSAATGPDAADQGLPKLTGGNFRASMRNSTRERGP
ncbi:MAG: hypothetical protein L6Q92_12580 [Phycisphaerae bacterium]|nr:hypothetical protein [Phycisphaerae bacterium]